MPMTRNEILYLSAGIAVGALAGANFHKIKESLAPLLALAGELLQSRLVVEQLQLRRTARHEKVNDVFGPGAEQGPLRRERILRLVRLIEQAPSILGVSPHLLAVARR